MSIIYILIPIAVLLTSLGIYLFFWAVRTEQFEDLEKQGMSILFDDERPKSTSEEKQAVVIKSREKITEPSTKQTSKKSTETATKQSTKQCSNKK